jgi:hypothetical protein
VLPQHSATLLISDKSDIGPQGIKHDAVPVQHQIQEQLL